MRAKYLSYENHNEPLEISAVLGEVVENVTAAIDMRHGDIVAEWETLAPGEWQLATPIGVKDGTLLVSVPDGSTASILRYQMNTLLGAITDRFGGGMVDAVRVTVERTRAPDSSRE